MICALGPGPTPATEPPADAGPIDTFELALVRASGLDEQALEAELGLRMPDLELRPHAEAGDPSTYPSPYIYVQIDPKEDGIFAIAVIVSDGRAYYGEIDTTGDLATERVAASTLTNMIISIEQGTVAPDREDATIPPPPPEPETAREPAVPVSAAPQVELETAAQEELELGLQLGITQALGLGPPSHGDVFLGGGAELGLQLRTRRGLHLFVGFRPLGRVRDGYRLTRLRAAVGVGYAWRGRQLELAAGLGLAFEPWLVSSTRGPEPVIGEDGRKNRPPLLSGMLRLAPGYHLEISSPGPLRGVRVGPTLELGGGFVPANGAKVAGLSAPDGGALFRLGGLELAAGFEAVLWWGAGGRR